MGTGDLCSPLAAIIPLLERTGVCIVILASSLGQPAHVQPSLFLFSLLKFHVHWCFCLCVCKGVGYP